MPSALRVRNSAKAIIFDSATASILLIEHLGKDGAYFTFPGGGQEHGETLTEAVERECIEEVGAAISSSSEITLVAITNSQATIRIIMASSSIFSVPWKRPLKSRWDNTRT